MAVNGDTFSMSAFTGRSNSTNWVELCEHHATLAAEDFSLHVTQFLQDNVTGDRQLTRRDFVNKFVDCFQRHFDLTQVLHFTILFTYLPNLLFCWFCPFLLLCHTKALKLIS